MLPFTAIPFVKSKNITDLSSDIQCKPSSRFQNDVDQDSTQCGEQSSADFYSSVISESSSHSAHTPALVHSNKRHREITPNSYTILYNRICNDDIESVRKWFVSHVPDNLTDDSPALDALKRLSDESGCNIAMTAAAHRSYESLKFLLNFFPVLSEGKDNYGNTLNDVVRHLDDEKLSLIVTKYISKLEKPAKKGVGSIHQTEEYCKQCNIVHRDPDHASSISHLFAENREVPEINPHLDPNNAGYKMMSQLGWSENKGLGKPCSSVI